MKVTEIVLIVKIIFTIVAWCIPLLFFPAVWFERLGFPAPHPIIFLRLLGASYLALTVNYYFGLKNLRHGQDVKQTLWVGVISNGIASFVLLFFGLFGAWRVWALTAQLLMWISALVTGLITLALICQLLSKRTELS